MNPERGGGTGACSPSSSLRSRSRTCPATPVRVRARPRPRPRIRMRARRRRDDAAASEVVGYVLMLFLSASVLVLSLQAFSSSRDTTQQVLDASQLKHVADRIASEVLQAGAVAVDMPNATYEVQVRLPPLDSRSYVVWLDSTKVHADTTDGMITAEAGSFQVGALADMTLQGSVYDTQGYVRIRYEKDSSGQRTIEIAP